MSGARYWERIDEAAPRPTYVSICLYIFLVSRAEAHRRAPSPDHDKIARAGADKTNNAKPHKF